MLTRTEASPSPAAPVDAPGARVAACYKWWVVFMLWFVCFFNYADRQAIFAVFPTLKKEFGFDTVELGLIGSAFMWVYAFGAPAGGIISDRLRRKELILGGCLFWSFVTVTTGWCSRLWHFIAVRALEGFGETIRILFRSPVVPLLMLAFVGANFVATIFLTWTPTFLVEKFGFRLAAAGMMNTVGWGGGALGPVFVGWASKYGNRPTEVENMSDAIAIGGAVYLVSAAMIAAAMWLHARQARRPSS
jgi:sugar phosphate permease